MTLILFHELGHFLTAKRYGWQTDKIELYPYGGISKLNTFVNTSLKEEFFVLIMGPITQIITYFLISFFLSSRNLEQFHTYHLFLLWFNMLPIYPLDGGKLLHLLLCKVIPFQKSFFLTMIESYFTIMILLSTFLLKRSYFFLLVLFLLFLKIQKEKELFPYIFHKFILERCMYNWHFKKKKCITRKEGMYKDTYHFFKINNEYIKEEEYVKGIIKEI